MTTVNYDQVQDSRQERKFLMVHYSLIKALGPNDAMFLSMLISRYELHKKKEELKKGDWYYVKIDTAFALTGMAEKAQNSRIDSLVKKNLIEVKNMGLPRRRHVRLNFEKILPFFADDEFIQQEYYDRRNEAKKKTSHLEAGPKPKKVQSLQEGEPSVSTTGEKAISKPETIDPPKGRDILYQSTDLEPININPIDIELPSLFNTKDEYSVPEEKPKKIEGPNWNEILNFVHKIKEKFKSFPKELYELLTSRVAKAYENNKDRYELFNKYYYVFPKVWELHKDKLSNEGFKVIFDDFFFDKEQVTVVKGYLENRIMLRLGLVDSIYKENDLFMPHLAIQQAFSEQEKSQYKRAYATFNGYFPWDHFNSVFDTQLSPQEIAGKRKSWENFKNQAHEERYGRAN